MYLETNRLYLRLFHPSDYYDLFEYLSDPYVTQYEPYGTFSLKQCRAEALMRSKNPAYIAVCLKDKSKLIGNLYLVERSYMTWELGYIFNRFYHHRGYALESCQTLLQYAFCQLEVRRITARCSMENDASWRLMERLSMRREACFLQDTFYQTDQNGVPLWSNSYHYALLRSEYFYSHPNYLRLKPSNH